MRAKSGLFKGLNPTMSLTALVVVALFVFFGAYDPNTAAQWFNGAKNAIIDGFKWYYILVVALFLFFAVFLVFSQYGDIRLGDDDTQPEYSYFSWFSMLFGAGMGIGLIFWSIAEPILHMQHNPFLQPSQADTPAAAQIAMRLTFFHWGLQPWAIYVIVSLALAFFCYRRKLPLAIRSVFYPILGERIYGFWGHAVDVLAIFGTIFGVATSLGLGVSQMNTGLHQLFDLAVNTKVQLILIGVISAIATLSAVSGVGKGVRILSEVNLWLSLLVLAFFVLLGPTTYILNSFVQNIGDYLSHIVPLSFWTNSGADGVSTWQSKWTVFYWGWWISWAPFVGMFIARISKGRTIREFTVGVLLVPALLGMFWLTAFGGTALHIALFQHSDLIASVDHNVTLALYNTINLMHIGHFTFIVKASVTLLIATYFITSSDSATVVVTTLLSVGDEAPPLRHRIFWGLGVGFVAAVLLVSGGLPALQAASIIAGLPFSIIMLFMCYALVVALRNEKKRLWQDRIRLQAQDGSPHLNLLDRIGPGNH